MTNPHGAPPPAEPERTIPAEAGPMPTSAIGEPDRRTYPGPPGPYPTQVGQLPTPASGYVGPPPVASAVPHAAGPAPAATVPAATVPAATVPAAVPAGSGEADGGAGGRMAYPDGVFEPPPEDPRRKGTIIAAVVTVLVVAAAGLAIGLLWMHFAPRVGVLKTAQGFVYADAEPEEAIAADGWFALLGFGAGALFAGLAYFGLRRYRGVAVLAGVVLGSLVGAWLAWWLGVRITVDQFLAARDTLAVGTRVDAPLVLRLTDLDRDALWPPRATGVAAAQALGAAITYTVLAGFSVYPNLRPPRTRTASSDPDVPADPTG